jgi:hypothetical protein
MSFVQWVYVEEGEGLFSFNQLHAGDLPFDYFAEQASRSHFEKVLMAET